MSFEDPTQRLSAPPRVNIETTTRLPRPLDLTGPGPAGDEPAGGTTELSLDEIFATEAPAATAMPVIPVRSEPVTTRAAQPPAAPAGSAGGGGHPRVGDRLRSDASAAWSAAVRRSSAWLARDDNGLMLMTAVVACVLILVVAAVG